MIEIIEENKRDLYFIMEDIKLNKRLISLITATTLTAFFLAQPVLSPMAAVNTPAQMEYLDRGTYN